MESVRAEETASLLRSIAASASAGATINLSQKVAALSNDIVTRAVFGGKFSQQRDFLHAIDQLSDLLGGFALVDLFPSSRLVQWLSRDVIQRIKSSYDVIHRIITDVLTERKAVRSLSEAICDQGLLDVLLTLQEEDSLESPLTTEKITAVLFVSTFFSTAAIS
jgi:hypothetical protein